MCATTQGMPCFTPSQVMPRMESSNTCCACCAPLSRCRLDDLEVLSVDADAILGALSQPDIGQLFPDSDPKWKGQTSDVFVREAVGPKPHLCKVHRLCI